MQFKLLVFFTLGFILSIPSFSQDKTGYKWWNPASSQFPVIEGQAWPKEVKNLYDRFPARAEKTVREEVWNLSRNSAGLYIKFKSNAKDIIVRYGVKGTLSFPHMPATGVSGVDLYGVDQNGKWIWAPGKYSFGDTIQYRFTNLTPGDDSLRNNDYRLYLPLYNTISWLEIGVPQDRNFTPIPLRAEKPIVVYGTSIAQGGCASRPGLAWTAMLERKVDRPLINLAFSGNGRLEKEVVDLITEIDAKMYVLDCLPNLTTSAEFSNEEVRKRIITSVRQIRAKWPATPILLVEHSGGNTSNQTNTGNLNDFDRVNEILQQTFAYLKSANEGNIYLLNSKEIDFNINATVDGVHPNDIGMEKYATAYEKTIRSILNEPVGTYSTTIPCVQSRDFKIYDWAARHQEVLSLNKTNPPKVVLLGNSITHYWGGNPVAPIRRGPDSWNKVLEPLGARNMGFGWDRVENVLWRVYHDELDGFEAKNIVIEIGTNNLQSNSDEEIIEGLKQLIAAIKVRQPKSRILLTGILPRKNFDERIAVLNKAVAQLSGTMNVDYIDYSNILSKSNGRFDEAFFEQDGVHPNRDGYMKIATALQPYLKNNIQKQAFTTSKLK